MAKKGCAIMTSVNYLNAVNFVKIAPETLNESRQTLNAFTRNRKMSFAQALEFMLDMRKTTLQTRLNLYFGKAGDEAPMSQQAFSKLRMNFDHSPFEKMHNLTVMQEYTESNDPTLWHGYHVFGVDGSYLQLPRAKELFEFFGIHGRPPQCPNAGISILFDVMHGWAVDPVITTANMSERDECLGHVNRLCERLPNIAAKSIILLDRGYPSLRLIKDLLPTGVKFVMRTSSNFLKEVTSAPLGDTIVTRDGAELRVVKIVLKTGEVQTLVTNLFDLPESLFQELYFKRWGIETAYFKLKRQLCIEKFTGKTVNSIFQDFWANMVLLNAVAVFQAEADQLVSQRAAPDDKHQYRARTSDLIISLRDRFIFAVFCSDNEFAIAEIENVITTMARSVSAIRPDRSFPRIHRPFSRVEANLKSHL